MKNRLSILLLSLMLLFPIFTMPAPTGAATFLTAVPVAQAMNNWITGYTAWLASQITIYMTNSPPPQTGNNILQVGTDSYNWFTGLLVVVGQASITYVVQNPIPTPTPGAPTPTPSVTPSVTPTPTGTPSSTPTPSPTPSPTPTYGPVILAPPTIAPFAGPTAAPVNVQISQSQYGGFFTATPPPGGIIGVGINNSTNVMTISPIGAGSGTITVAGALGYSTTLNFLIYPTPSPSPSPSPTATATATAAPSSLRINSGGSATGSFIADQYYSGSGTYPASTSTAITTTGIPSPVAPQAVWQSQLTCTSTCTYTIPGFTPGNSYSVQLDFAESYFTVAGDRKFNVSINGTTVLTNFDIVGTAGAEYAATAQMFITSANAAGQIVIVFTPVTNYPVVNGIEILSTNQTPAPTPTPTSTPISTPTPTASPGTTPTPLALKFYGNSPFKHKVGTMLNNGAQIVTNSATLVSNMFGTGAWPSSANTAGLNSYPTWTGMTTDPNAYAPTCTPGGQGTCASGQPTVYYQNGVFTQCQPASGVTCTYDHHFNVDLPFDNGAFAGWECGSSASPPGTNFVECGSSAFWPYSGSGLALTDLSNPNDAPDAGSYNPLITMLTAYDLMQPTIGHAFGVVMPDIGANAVYPAFNHGLGTGTSYAPYGYLLAIKSGVSVSTLASGHSPECLKLLTAFQTYGLYIADIGGGTINIPAEAYGSAAGGRLGQTPNPWDALEADMVKYGDGSGSGNTFSTSWCLNLANSASDWEFVQLSNNEGVGNNAPLVTNP
jgi:hypothetical protein